MGDNGAKHLIHWSALAPRAVEPARCANKKMTASEQKSFFHRAKESIEMER